MKRLLVNLIYKKTSIKIDENIPLGVVLSFCTEKAFAMFRGFFKLGRLRAFVARGVTIKQKRKIFFKGTLRLEKNVTLDALSIGGISFGSNCSVGKNTRIECSGSLSLLGKGFSCGDNCGLGTDSFYGCAGGITMGSDVIVGNFVSMHSQNHNFDDLNVPIRLQGVNSNGIFIGNNIWIGAKATILDGTKIGDGSIIAAGAVVKGEFPQNSIIAGVPAKVIKIRTAKG